MASRYRYKLSSLLGLLIGVSAILGLGVNTAKLYTARVQHETNMQAWRASRINLADLLTSLDELHATERWAILCLCSREMADRRLENHLSHLLEEVETSGATTTFGAADTHQKMLDQVQERLSAAQRRLQPDASIEAFSR